MSFVSLFGELHGSIIVLLAVAIIYSDYQGYLYLSGKKLLLPVKMLQQLHQLIWGGLLLMIVTGVALIIPKWHHVLQEPVFYVKMGFVLTLIFNGLAIGSLSKLAGKISFAELTSEQQKTLIISGALSAISWIGAWFIGFALL